MEIIFYPYLSIRIIPCDLRFWIGRYLYDPLHRLRLAHRLVEGGEPILPDPEKALVSIIYANIFAPCLGVLGVISHNTHVVALVLLLNIVKKDLLFNNL